MATLPTVANVERLIKLWDRLARDGITCALEPGPPDVPKLYAVRKDGRTGPHEIVSALPDLSLDLWWARKGQRIPTCKQMNVTEDEAYAILRSDWEHGNPGGMASHTDADRRDPI